MDLPPILAFCRRWLALLVLVPVLAAGAALFYVSTIEPVYEAQVTLQVSPGTPGTSSPQDAAQLVQTYAEAIRVRDVLQAAAEQAGVQISPGDLAKRLSARAVRDTELLRVVVDETDPQIAARLANAVATVFMATNREHQVNQFASSRDNLAGLVASVQKDMDERTREIQTLKAQPDSQARTADIARLQAEVVQLQDTYGATLRSYEDLRVAEARNANTLIVLESAEPPGAPIYPRPLQTALLAGVAGLTLAILMAGAAQRFDDRLRDPSRVATEIGLTPLGTIPRMRDGWSADPEQLSKRLAGSYRLVRSSLLSGLGDRPHRSLLLTSPDPGDGKSVVAACLAIALAESGEQVVLVDADLHRPKQTDLFEIAGDTGLSSLLTDPERSIGSVLQPADVPNLWILPAGPLAADASGLLTSRRFEHRLRELLRLFEVVLIDAPPVLAAPDAALLGSSSDGVIMVLDATRSRGRRARKALETLTASGATVVGSVLNKVSIADTEYSAYAGVGDTQDERTPRRG